MAIKFRIFKRTVLLGKDKGKTKIFAQSVTTKKITFKRFCEEVADGSTVDSADVKAIFDRMVKVLKRHMADGEAVDCGELGTFTPTFGSVGIDEKETFVASKHIKDPKVSFRAKPEFKDLSGVSFERISEEEEAARKALAEKKKGKKKPGGGSEPGGGGVGI
jgi:putative DNA-binding protein